LIENIANFENTPDVGLSLNLAWLSLKPITADTTAREYRR